MCLCGWILCPCASTIVIKKKSVPSVSFALLVWAPKWNIWSSTWTTPWIYAQPETAEIIFTEIPTVPWEWKINICCCNHWHWSCFCVMLYSNRHRQVIYKSWVILYWAGSHAGSYDETQPPMLLCLEADPLRRYSSLNEGDTVGP